MSNDEFSSVEWLYNKMVLKLCNKLQTIEYTHIFLEELEQAKEMHKEEMVMFVLNVIGKYRHGDVLAEVATELYEQTYGGNK